MDDDALSTLPEPERHVLEALSIFRAPVELDVLKSIFSGSRSDDTAIPLFDEAAIQSALESLHRLDLIVVDEHGYSAHPAIRPTCYQSLGERRQLFHRRAASILFALFYLKPRHLRWGPVSLDSIEEVVYHSAEGGSVPYAAREYVMYLGGYPRLAWELGEYERGLRITSHLVSLGGIELVGNPSVSPWFDRSLYHLDLGRPALAEAQMRELLDVLPTLHAKPFDYKRGDSVLHGMQPRQHWLDHVSPVLQSLCDALLVQGKLQEAEQVAGEVVTELERLAEKAIEAGEIFEHEGSFWAHARERFFRSGSNPYGRRAVARGYAGRIREALADFEAAARLHQQLPEERRSLVPPWSYHAAEHALLLIRLGRLHEAAALLARCPLPRARQERPLLGARYDLGYAELYLAAGKESAALPHIEAARGWARHSGHQESYTRAILLAARLLLRQGDWPRARTTLQEAEQIVRASHFTLLLIDALVLAGHGALQAGESKQAAAWASEALALCTAPGCGYAWGLGSATHLLAEIAHQRGSDSAALSHVQWAATARQHLGDPRLGNTQRLLEKIRAQ